jgi:hypothetical protein
MVHKDIIERRKAKQKAKGLTGGKILDDTRHKGPVEPEALEPTPFIYRKKNAGKTEKEKKVPKAVKKPSVEKIPRAEKTIIKEILEEDLIEVINEDMCPVVEQSETESAPDNEQCQSIDFSNGKNTLSVRYRKCSNRQFRIQIFLNDTIEIRPVSYTGSSTGNAFWALIKGVMKK